MKRFLSVTVVLCCLVFAMPAQAQIKFGVKAGVNMNKVDFTSSVKSQDYTGFYVGPMVDVNIPFLGFGVDGALLYSQKGIDAQDANSSKTTIKEIAIPLNLKYTLGFGSTAGFFVAAGPQFAFNMDKNANDGQRDYSFKTANMSFNIGAGFKLMTHFQISATYNIPINKSADYSNSSENQKVYNCKTKGWLFGLAYLF